jgi:hypothetical protein
MEKPQIEMGVDFIRIMLKNPPPQGRTTYWQELVCWYRSEWEKDPALVFKIVEAVTVAAYEPELLEATLKRLQ